MKIAFIGGGNMATAILASMCAQAQHKSESFFVADPIKETRRRHANNGHKTFASAARLPDADACFLCVKPQDIETACADLAKGSFTGDKAVISIAAGIPTARLATLLGSKDIVRTMPNTPVMVGEGCTFAHGPNGPESNAARLARDCFSTMGQFHWVEDERLMDVATALSGSGPAYGYVVIETMSAVAERMGMEHKAALEATIATLKGACKMAEQANESPQSLRKKVTSKGGTTEAALKMLYEKGFAEALDKAMEAAKKRSEELSG